MAANVGNLEEERKELERKLQRLEAFMFHPDSNKLDQEDQRLLRQQRAAMSSYLEVLERRLQRLHRPPPLPPAA